MPASPPTAAPPAAPDAASGTPRKYGERTVGLMIQSAVEQSKSSGNGGLILGLALGCVGLLALAVVAAALIFVFLAR